MTSAVAFAATLFTAIVAAQGPVLHQRSVLAGRVTLLVPDGFSVMSDEMRERKYPSSNRPDVVFTNDRTTVNVALRHAPDRLPASALREAHKSVESSFRNMYPSAAWFRSEIIRQSGREWFLIDLRTPAIDTEVRNIIVATSLDDRFLMISFNATKQLESEWLDAGERIIRSIVVK